MRYFHNALICVFALVGLGSAGCASSGYPQMLDYHSKLAALKGQGEGIPEARARFCLERANRLYQKAERNTAVDYGLLSLGGATAGVGVVSSAVAGAMDKNDSNKTSFEIAGAALIASSAAFLSVRTALGLYDVSRAEREAAARNVDAALGILTEYALADDPGLVDHTKLTTCSDGEVAVGNAFAGASASLAIERLTAQKEKDAAEDKKEAKAVRKAAVQKLDEANEILAKSNDASAQPSASAKPPKGAGTADSKGDAADQKEKKEKAASLQALEAKVEMARADVLDAKAEVETKKAAILRAARQLRAATFFLTATDVELANAGLTTAREELDAVKKALDAASERLIKAENDLADAQRKAKS